MRMTIATLVIGAVAAGCAHRRDDRIASCPTGAAPANPQPAYGAKVERSNRSAATEDERLRASVRERYGAPTARPPATVGASSRGPAADQRLAARVKQTLASSKDTRALKLGVRAENGIVTLEGYVRTAAQKRKAVELARGVAGAKAVRDAITVGAAAQR